MHMSMNMYMDMDMDMEMSMYMHMSMNMDMDMEMWTDAGCSLDYLGALTWLVLHLETKGAESIETVFHDWLRKEIKVWWYRCGLATAELLSCIEMLQFQVNCWI